MELLYGIFPESYKHRSGKRTKEHPLSNAPHTIHVTVGKQDFMPLTVLVSAKEDFSLQLGSYAWFTERGELPTVRVETDLPLAAELFHEKMHRDTHDQLYYADALLPTDVAEYYANDIGAVCVMLRTDKATLPGNYRGSIRLLAADAFGDETEVGRLEVSIDVYNLTLRHGRENRFYLDLWQHPSNIARHADVRLWSDEHFAVLKEYWRSLAALGQRALTVIVTETPWDGQGCSNRPESGNNIFEFSIVPITRRRDGSFFYDFSIMQRYIDGARAAGIRDEISLYGLINVWAENKLAEDHPDKLRIRYFDEETGCYRYMRSADEIDAYVKALEQYFIETKQIDRVRVSADEPSNVAQFRERLNRLQRIAPAFRFKAAINHVEFIEEFGESFSDFVPYLSCVKGKLDCLRRFKRTMPDKRFLWYTCCGPKRPNTFLSSPLVESHLIGILTSAYGLDGYLRWDYTVWTKDPLNDLSYGDWKTGDMLFVYPGKNGHPILTLRYYALMRGIQLYELLYTYRARFGKTRMMQLIQPLFSTTDVSAFDSTYTTDYACYEALRRNLLEALAN